MPKFYNQAMTTALVKAGVLALDEKENNKPKPRNGKPQYDTYREINDCVVDNFENPPVYEKNTMTIQFFRMHIHI